MKIKKLLSILLPSVCALILAITTVFIPLNNANASSNVYSVDNTDLIASVTKELEYSNGNAKANRSGYINLQVSLNKAVAQGTVVKVYYHTENISAVAFNEAKTSGDYAACDSYITFSGSQTVKSVSIEVIESAYSVLVEDGEVGRTFKFVLDSISSGSIEDGSKQTICQIGGQTQFTAVKESGMKYYAFDDYLGMIGSISTDSAHLHGCDVWCSGSSSDYDKISLKYSSDEDDLIYSDITMFTGEEQQYYKLKYIDTGIASAYLTTTFDCAGEYFLCPGDMDFDLYTAEGTSLLSLCMDGIFEVNGLGYGEYGQYLRPIDLITIVTKTEGYNNPYEMDEDTYYEKNLVAGMGGIPIDIYSSRHTKDYTVMQPYGESNSYCFLQIPDDEEIGGFVTVYNEVSLRTRWVDGISIYSAIIDTKAPEIEEYYFDDSTFDEDGKVRVSIRFSEPVQIQSGVNPTIKVNFKYGTTDQLVTFKYAGGDKTDTLCFETNLDDAGLAAGYYGSAVISEITGAAGIGDFAYIGTGTNVGCFNKLSSSNVLLVEKKLSSLSIDYRSPLIEKTSIKSNAVSSKIMASRDFSLTCQNITKGTVYYSFTDDSTVPTSTSDYQYSIRIPDNAMTDKNGDYVVKFSVSGLSGEKYLHVRVESDKYIGEDDKSSCFTYGVYSGDTLTGGYLFDNSIPNIGDISFTVNKLDTKTITFDITKEQSATISKLDSIFMSVIPENESGEFDESLISSYCVWADSESENKKTSLTGSSTYVEESETKGKYTLTLSATDNMFGLSLDENAKSSGRYQIAFYCIDSAGNVSELTDYTILRYNLNSTLTTTASCLQSATVIETNNVYDLSTGDITLVFERAAANEDSFAIYSINRGNDSIYQYTLGDDWKEEISSYFDVDIANTTDTKITLNAKIAGYYEIIPCQVAGDTVTTSSDIHAFYITSGKDVSTLKYSDESENYNLIKQGLVLNNKVFTVSTKFVYLNGSNTLEIVNANYGNCSYPAAFSSQSKAKEYVLAYEYKDLYLIKINSVQATNINANANYYEKAENENKKAEEGQWWIRYKRSSWTYSSSQSDWVMYFYQDSNPTAKIDTYKLSDNLKSAMDEVASYIVGSKSGNGYINLIGEDYIDSQTNAPKLKDGQSHISEEYITETISGTSFITKVTFTGDEEICSNEVNVTNSLGEQITVPLASNLALSISSYTKLYARAEGTTDYVRLKAKSGQLFKDVLASTFPGSTSSLYEVLEIGGLGVREFYAYIDSTAPNLKIDLVRFDETEGKNITESRVLTGDNDGNTLSYTKFILKGFVNEIDEFAYVAECSSTGSIKNVYYADDLAAGIYFEDGSYNIEIGDRSGNKYTLTLKVSSDTLDCTVTQSEEGINVRCTNRDEDQIYRYEVSCNDEVISNTFSSSKTYKDSGNYYIYIRDIYGNVFTYTTSYIRPFPSVTMYYSETYDGDLVEYDKDAQVVKVEEKVKDSGVYYITTSAYLMLKLSSDCKYTMEGLTSGVDYTVSTSILDGTISLRIRSLKNWVLSIGYSDGSNVNVKYICSVEITAPQITGYYKAEQYVVNDYNGLYTTTQKQASLNESFKKGDVIIPNDISYTSNYTNQVLLTGSQITSTYIRVTMSDISGIKSYSVTKDGVLIDNSKVEKKIIDGDVSLIFRSNGSYVIKATDNYNNTATYTFVNGSKEYSNYYIDDNLIDNYLAIDSKTYGHSNAIVTVNNDGSVLVKVKANNSTYFYYFNVVILDTGINVYHVDYIVKENSDGTLDVGVSDNSKDNLVFNSLDTKTIEDVWYSLANDTEDFTLQVKYLEKNVYFRVVNNIDKLSVESRVICDNCIPYYNNTEFSTEQATLTLISNGDEVVTYVNQVILLNNAFDIQSQSITDKIKSVYLAYSKDQSFEGLLTYEDVIKKYTSIEKYSANEGFYLIRVTNIYGNVTDYIINISKSFDIVVYTKYSNVVDNYDVATLLQENTFTNEYFENKGIYSNSEVTLYIYANDITLKVNSEVKDVTKREDGVYEYTLSGNGNYTVSVTDKYSVVKNVHIEINKLDLEFSDNVFDEKNSDSDVLYTKDKLSINKNELNDSIYYVSYKYNSKETVIYDALSPNSEIGNKDTVNVSEVIGADGDGEYIVYVRDIYGNLAFKRVNYSGVPTLTIKRLISSNDADEVIDVNDAVKNGVWSNSQIALYSTAVSSELYIDENTKSSCPQIVRLDSVTGDASLERQIRYTDEYGYDYTFMVYLVRQSITVEPSSSIVIEDIDGVLTTKDNITVKFSSDAQCVYYLNGVLAGTYNGQELSKDGIYKFVATDKAGNTNSYVLKRDTNCEFTFTESGNYNVKEVLNGGVTTTSVYFAGVNDDSVYIHKIVLNGKELADYEGTTFSDDGKWEFLIADKIGNMAYYSFNIITHSLSTFSYTAPYDYYIEKFWYDTSLDTETSNRRSVLSEIHQTSFEVDTDGIYTVIIKSDLTGSTESFSFTIDNTPPDITLKGCEEGEITTETVYLNGCEDGDTIEIYKDGELISQYTLSYQSEVPEITEGGSYKIVVTNKAGVSTTLTFEKKHIVNTAGSIFIICIIVLMITALFVGLLFRKRTKVDK